MIRALSIFAALLLGTSLSFSIVLNLGVRLAELLARKGYTQGVYWKSVFVMMVLALLVAIAHLVAIALWAVPVMICGGFERYEDGFYLSAMNYTTLGYGDVVLPPDWRLLGPLEAVNGVLLLGLSTAVIFAVMNQLFEKRVRREHPGGHWSDKAVVLPEKR